MRRSSFKDNFNNSVKDKEDILGKGKDQDINKSNDLSQSDSKGDRKNEDKDNAIINTTSDEKKESKWDTIDWSKKSTDKIIESKWDTIDWSKKSSEDEKESKWDTIDWSKKSSEDEKESKWDTIDWSKSENEKTEENKYENIKDKSMNGEEFKEDFQDLNEKEINNDFIQESNKESDDRDNDLSWLKDYDKNSEDEKFEDLSRLKDYDKNIEDEKLEDLSWLKDYDKHLEESVFLEGIEKQQDEFETIEKNLDQKHTDEKKNSNKDYEVQNIKNEIKNLDWENYPNDWTAEIYINQYSELKKIQLDPKQDSSKNNPLYMNEDWLKKVYNDKKLNLNDKIISEVCGVDSSTIGKWRQKFSIPTKPKGPGRFLDSKGRVMLKMPKDYKHPELKPKRGDEYYRPEHIAVMEQHLSNDPDSPVAKNNLIDGKYLRTGCEVHHLNFNPKDNRIENLWLYDNKMEHAKGELTVRDSLKILINTDQISFKDGKYYINDDYDSKSNKYIQKPLNQDNVIPVNYKNIDLINNEIKKIEWGKESEDWKVKIYINQSKEKIILLDPYKDCCEKNPLYRKEEWVKLLVNDKRFNLTNSRLGELCGISKDKARYWKKKHNIKGKTDWGYERIIDKSDGRIWAKVPSNYGNPVVNKKDEQRRYMLEHRYVVERHLAKHPELEISNKVLIDGKYLKSECQVHHINLNYQDNRLENLWIFENVNDHNEATKSLYSLVDELLKSKKVIFKDGEYLINNEKD